MNTKVLKQLTAIRERYTSLEEMAGALPLSVPLKVDVAAGPNWLDVEDV